VLATFFLTSGDEAVGQFYPWSSYCQWWSMYS